MSDVLLPMIQSRDMCMYTETLIIIVDLWKMHNFTNADIYVFRNRITSGRH